MISEKKNENYFKQIFGDFMGIKVREKKKGSDEWWIYINYCGKRTAKKIGGDKQMAIAISSELEKRLILGELEMNGLISKLKATRSV